MKTIYNHHHRSRENVPQDYRKSVTERQIRRRRARIAAKAERRARIAAKLAENPRLVRA